MTIASYYTLIGMVLIQLLAHHVTLLETIGIVSTVSQMLYKPEQEPFWIRTLDKLLPNGLYMCSLE